jgi:hypothetical protein
MPNLQLPDKETDRVTMTADKIWGPFARDLATQRSAGPLSGLSFKEANFEMYKTDNASQFSSASILNVEDDVYLTNRAQNRGADLPDGPPESGKNESQLLESVHDVLPPLPTHDAPDFEGDDIPKGRSLGHPLYNNKQAYFISFDIETRGEYVGTVHLSAQVIWMKMVALGSSKTKDRAKFVVDDDISDSYVNPKVSPALWNDCLVAVHGICPHDEWITGANEIQLVWHRFLQWILKHVPPGEYATLVAWNRAACDLKWQWKLTQAPNSQLVMPP